MTAAALLTASASIVLMLGCAHLVYTFFGPRLRPRDPALIIQMQQVHPVITRGTTMWKAWIGFNASHSLGAMLFGLVYGYLALQHPQFLFDSNFLLGLGLAFLLAMLVLARAYWFRVPLAGIALATALYVGAWVWPRV